MTNDGQRVVELLTAFGAVVDGKLEDRFAFTRCGNNASHMLGREDGRIRHLEISLFWFVQDDGYGVLIPISVPVNDIGASLVEQIF